MWWVNNMMHIYIYIYILLIYRSHAILHFDWLATKYIVHSLKGISIDNRTPLFPILLKHKKVNQSTNYQLQEAIAAIDRLILNSPGLKKWKTTRMKYLASQKFYCHKSGPSKGKTAPKDNGGKHGSQFQLMSSAIFLIVLSRKSQRSASLMVTSFITHIFG